MSDVRAPWTTRAQTSRPERSVPSRWSVLGGTLTALTSVKNGLLEMKSASSGPEAG